MVRESYENTPSADIARKLGRPVGSVCKRAAQLGAEEEQRDDCRDVTSEKLEQGNHGSVQFRFSAGHV